MVNIVSGWNKPPTPAQLQNINDFKKMVTPAGMDYAAYLDTKRSPSTPIQRDLDALWSSGTGDKGYEAEQINNFYQSDQGKKIMNDFYTANSDWYNADGSRTNKGLTPLDIKASEWLNGGRVGVNPVSAALRDYKQGATANNSNNLPASVPSQAPQNDVLRPSVVNAQPVARQQAQAQAIRDFKPQPQQNPSWQPGGWS